MLRCPPSVINLTPSDLIDLERRQIARLSNGPCRSTRSSIVAANDNVGLKTAGALSSKATLVDGTLEPTTSPPIIYTNATLDPDAPVFVPRTRYGSTTQSSVESQVPTAMPLRPRWSSLDSTHTASNLRIRPISERNIGGRSRQAQIPEDDVSERNVEVASSTHWSSEAVGHGQDRAGHQNAIVMQARTDLERDPLVRPPSTGFHGNVHVRIAPAMITHGNNVICSTPRPRSNSPAISGTTYSMPNLLSVPTSDPGISSRESSGSWLYSRPHWSQANSSRVPSMVSAASGISGHISAQEPRRDSFDATEEFVRRRNSPLDELTEKFSRMRSVGRSWERSPESVTRPSLLNGDPFGQGLNSAVPTSVGTSVMQPPQCTGERDVEYGSVEDLPVVDPVGLALAMPTSPSLSSASQSMPSPPRVPGTFPVSPWSPLADTSPIKSQASPESSTKLKPIATRTPKLDVYKDSQPPGTQPETPGDLRRSQRPKTRMHTTRPTSLATVRPVLIGSPLTDFERRYHRERSSCTVDPSQSGFQGSSAVTSAVSSGMTPSRNATGRRTERYTRDLGVRSEAKNNDLEHHLPGLEEDRRIWLARQESGTLDVTPPKEGRFERFLS